MASAPETHFRVPNDRGSAVVGGGGQNIYDRLMQETTKTLVTPSATAIGGPSAATKISHMPSMKPVTYSGGFGVPGT